MRKIRYDVLRYLEEFKLTSRIEKYLEIENKELEIGKELIAEAKLNYCENIADVEASLRKYLSNVSNYNSVEHSILLDYIMPLESATDNYQSLYDELYNFMFQLVQIQKIQAKLLETFMDTVYIGEDNNIYSVVDNKVLINKSDIIGKADVDDDYEYQVIDYVSDKILSTKNEIILQFEYSDDGYYISGNGVEYFNDNDKESIISEVESRLSILFSDIDTTSNEDNIENNEQIDDFIDDVTAVKKKTITKESEERINNLNKSLKESATKIKGK
ncbi:MAG: hypothetical protein E7361_02365 [Clostridiales bacterium]|nr:hypothetical protein [Clostridiales bacterium]